MAMRNWLVSSLLGVLAFTGCGEVEHCEERVTPGCLYSAPRSDGTCLYDLAPFQRESGGPVCLKAGVEPDPCTLCGEGALCVPERGQCVSFCEQPPVLPGTGTKPETIFCEAVAQTPGENPMLTFDEVCRRRCRLECQRIEQLCGAPCEQGRCERPEVQLRCVAECPRLTPTGGRDLACLTQKCNDQRLARCTRELACPNGATVDCSPITCTNDCRFPNDGQCDDGDIMASDGDECAWGSDCADCGVRKGQRPPGFLGDICRYHSNCAGGTLDPSTADAWCVSSLSLPGVARCMPDCSRRQRCEEGFECREITFDTDGVPGGAREPIVVDGRRAQACMPSMCI